MATKDTIQLSPKPGLNPAIPMCYFCGKAKQEIILAGRLSRDDMEAPRAAVWDKSPCDECRDWMTKGVILISVRDNDQDYRTGGWVVIKDDALRRLMSDSDMLETILKCRHAFVSDTVWAAFGLDIQVDNTIS